MKEKIAFLGIQNVCQVWIQNESRQTEPHSFSVLDKAESHNTFSSLWNSMTNDEKSYMKTILQEEQKWAEQEEENDHLFVYTRTLEVIEEVENEVTEPAHYYKKHISEYGKGRWNVIQVIDDKARYFVLKGEIDNPEPMPFLSLGWIETGELGPLFTDGEDFTSVEDWEKVEGILINF